MRFAIVDPWNYGLSWARRLHDEGCDVLMYTHPKWQRDIGKNLVHKTESLHHIAAWAKENNAIAVFMGSGFGKRHVVSKQEDAVPIGADEFRKMGIPTICGGSFCDRMEQDRRFGEQIAKVIGCRVPPTKEFSSLSETIAFAKSVGDQEWYFKSDKFLGADATHGGTGEQLVRYLTRIQKERGNAIKNILQMKIPGVALSTACWYNGKAFVPPFEATIEHKKFLNGDIGPSTGASLNAVWFYDTDAPKVVQSLHWDALDGIFNRFDAPAGLYDMNAIIAEKDGPWGPAGEAYFLEWTSRHGWDSEGTSPRLLEMPLCDFLTRLVQGRLAEAPFTTKKIAYSTRLSVSPYPFENYKDDKGSAKGTPIYGADGLWQGHFIPYSVMLTDEDELQVADRWGCVGLTLAVGTSLKNCHDEAMEYAKKTLEIPSLQYRTDGARVIAKDAQGLKALGYEVSPGLLR